MFIALTSVICAIVAVAMAMAYRHSKDVFHPALLFGAQLLFLYVYMPLRLLKEGELGAYLTHEQGVFAQVVNLFGVAAFLIGMRIARPSVTALKRRHDVEPRKVLYAAAALGAMGLAAYAYSLAFVGGFSAAYGDAAGGGSAESGYVREAVLLTIPATLLLFSAWRNPALRLPIVLLAPTFVAPHAIHALFGARRGPAFIALTSLIVGWYLLRRRRPPLSMAFAGGLGVGLAMLALVANRDTLYLGASWALEKSPAEFLAAGTGNEFLFGSAATVTASERNQFTWGARLATVLFVRPIPRMLWPTKYDDAARWFGTPSMEMTAGIDRHAFHPVVGWTGAVGSAPGLIADLWVEFAWGSALLLGAVGWAVGRAWQNQRVNSGFATVLYGIVMCLSVYLVMQTVEAALFRFLIMAIPTRFLWWWSRKRRGTDMAHPVRPAHPLPG